MSRGKPYGFVRLLIASLPLVAGVAGAEPAEPVLVMGMTGRQGHAAVDQLLARGDRLRGMTRKLQGKKARQLAERGVEIVAGDYRDPDSLRAALSGAHGVFCYSGFTRDELGQGRNVIAADQMTLEQYVRETGWENWRAEN